jgi:cbb3-type cytochrome oxidase maturation protein
MTIIFLLLPITLAIAGGFLWAFFWAARQGEFDDLETPAHRILFDDQEITTKKDEELTAAHEAP